MLWRIPRQKWNISDGLGRRSASRGEKRMVVRAVVLRSESRFGNRSYRFIGGSPRIITGKLDSERLPSKLAPPVKLPDMKRLPSGVRLLIFITALYVFLLSITLLGDGFKGLGSPFVRTLLSFTANPLSALFIGILATTIVQSSSCTTSLVVGLVASGTIGITNAIPIIMGANIGTTVTNTIVSFAHVTRRQEFGRAFPAAVVHDIFNILSVAVLLPLETFFHPIAWVSGLLAKVFAGVGGFTFASPLKFATEPVADSLAGFVQHKPVLMLLIAIILLYIALRFIVGMMRSLVSRRLGLVIDKYLFGNATKAFLIGLAFTALVQSSSVTISIAVPMAGAGLLTLRQVFPYSLGANIGTTVTAILAALVTGSVGAIQIAFAHLVFNITGSLIWYPLKVVPLGIATWWGEFCARRRIWAFIYAVVVFIAIPLAMIILIKRR